MKKKLKTIVCGTTFGKYYLKALERVSSEFEITGIIGKGSECSKRLANKYNIPFYLSVEELPENIDLACVIVRAEGVGGDGTELCLKLLNKGINVIQEQPVYQRHLAKCYKLAKENNLIYITSNLYSHLPNVKNFIMYAKKLNSLSKLEYINVSFSTQVSYIAIDLISMCGISGDLVLSDKVIKDVGPFQVLSGHIGEIPILIEFNNKLNPNFPDYNMHLMYSLKFYYEDGVLALDDAFGNVTWRPRTYIKRTLKNADIDKEFVYTTLYKLERKNVQDFLNSYWINSIIGELIETKGYIENGKINVHRVNRELSTSKKWEKLQKVAGYAEFTYENKEKLLSLKEIENFKNNF